MRHNIGYGRVALGAAVPAPGRLRPRPATGRAQGRRAGERRPAGHLPARPRRPAVVAGAQADRSRAAAPEPGLPAGEPRPAQRVVRRRRGVEHRDHRALPHHLRAAARGPGAAAGRHAGPADVRVRADARGRLPGRRLAARAARRCCWSTSGSSTPTTPRRRCTGGPTSPCPRRTTYASSHPPTRPGSSRTTGALRRVPIPVLDGLDRTYTTRASEAADYFFAIDDDQRRWIAALDGRGTGLVQTSTDRLRGRKLFLWGKSAGRRPLAGVARAARHGVPRDPGRAGPHPARAPAHAGPGVVVVGRGVRPARERRRTPSTATTGRGPARRCPATWRQLVPRAELDQVLADTAALGRLPRRSRC